MYSQEVKKTTKVAEGDGPAWGHQYSQGWGWEADIPNVCVELDDKQNILLLAIILPCERGD